MAIKTISLGLRTNLEDEQAIFDLLETVRAGGTKGSSFLRTLIFVGAHAIDLSSQPPHIAEALKKIRKHSDHISYLVDKKNGRADVQGFAEKTVSVAPSPVSTATGDGHAGVQDMGQTHSAPEQVVNDPPPEEPVKEEEESPPAKKGRKLNFGGAI